MSERSRGAVLVWVAVAVLAALALWRVAGASGGHADSPIRIDGGPDAAGPARGGQDGGAGRGGADNGAGIYVHVAGAVRRPGLVRMPAGMRVAAALERAGGPTRRADLAGVNLAARLEDGQQLVVPNAAAAGGAAGAGAAGSAGAAAARSATGATGAKPSLGSASADQLDQLDGIGPTLAKRIVEYRIKHGGFRSLDDLREVEGIGDKRLEALRQALQP